MQALLVHPAVQGGLAPLLAGMVAALVLFPVRLSGLAAACGFFAAVYLTGQLALEKRLLMVSLAAPLLGALADVVFKPTRSRGIVLGVVFGIACFWIFVGTLGRMPAQKLLLYSIGVTLLVAAAVALAGWSQDEPPRAGAAGVGLGVATGGVAYLGGADVLALWGFGLAAGSAGFLIVALALGPRIIAGASLTLSIGVIGAALASAVTLQRWLPWHYAALLALVPLAVRLPVPGRGAGAQTLAALAYALMAAAVICALVWWEY